MTKPIYDPEYYRKYIYPLHKWQNECPELDSGKHGAALSIHNADMIVHQYYVQDRTKRIQLRRQHLMFIEYKTCGGHVEVAQRDTLGVVDQCLQMADRSYVDTLRGKRMLYYWGLHVWILSSTTPTNSEWMTWDGRPITEEGIIKTLRFEWDPNTLEPRKDADRTHHKQYPLLFGLEDARDPAEANHQNQRFRDGRIKG